jgi:hypothetical protein
MQDARGVESGIPTRPYSPHVEYFGFSKDIARPFPMEFRDRFHRVSEGIYPQESIQQMRADGYNPAIIGYAHTGRPEEIEAIKKKFGELKQQNPTLKVLQEIDPQQLQWIREFLEAETEYKASGTVGGKSVRSDEMERMQNYRRSLQSNNAEHLSLWYLDNGINVTSIEHPDVKKWIQADRVQGIWGEEEETFGSSRGPDLQPFYTAVRRDIHGLQVTNQERPDVIAVGSMHALKYDMLLEREGQRSFYYLDRPFEWETILRHWENMHGQYAKQSKQH